jgi:hypothetical protein
MPDDGEGCRDDEIIFLNRSRLRDADINISGEMLRRNLISGKEN